VVVIDVKVVEEEGGRRREAEGVRARSWWAFLKRENVGYSFRYCGRAVRETESRRRRGEGAPRAFGRAFPD